MKMMRLLQVSAGRGQTCCSTPSKTKETFHRDGGQCHPEGQLGAGPAQEDTLRAGAGRGAGVYCKTELVRYVTYEWQEQCLCEARSGGICLGTAPGGTDA